jgi:hypothetical protein
MAWGGGFGALETAGPCLLPKLLFLAHFRCFMASIYPMRRLVDEDRRTCTIQRAVPARGFWIVRLCAELFSWDGRWSEPNESLGRH